MKADIKKLPKCEVELEIEVSEKELGFFIKEAGEELAKDITIEGFRKGKAPLNIVEEKIGKENILMEAAEMAIKENYQKAVLENKLEPIGQPKIEIIKLVEGSPLIFKASAAILPEIKLPDYKKIASDKKRNKVEVSENEIEEAIKWLLKSRAKFSLKNGPAEKGDFVEISYQSEQIKELDKGGQKDSFVLGEGRFISGFEENIIGMKSGEEKEFSSVFPFDYLAKDLAGKKVDFKISLKSVQKMELPQMNDEFVKSLGRFDNAEALKNNIIEGIKMEKEQAESQKLRQEIVSDISKATEMEIPEILIKNEQDALIHNLKHEIEEKLKTSFEEYLKKIKKTEKEIIDSLYSEAEKRVRDFLTLREIGIKEKIEVSDQEVKEEADRFLKQYSDIKDAEKNIDVERLKNYTKEVIRNEKIFKILEESNNKS